MECKASLWCDAMHEEHIKEGGHHLCLTSRAINLKTQHILRPADAISFTIVSKAVAIFSVEPLVS